jgi:hypothetical protein
MHTCPHCGKLGISSFDTIANPFSYGRASCRYCGMPSKRTNRVLAYAGGPATILLWYGWIRLIHASMPYQWFWLAVIGFGGIYLIDRFTKYERVEVANHSKGR